MLPMSTGPAAPASPAQSPEEDSRARPTPVSCSVTCGFSHGLWVSGRPLVGHPLAYFFFPSFIEMWQTPSCKCSMYNVIFDIYCEMVTTIRLVNTSIISHSYHCVCVCVVRTFQIHSLSKLQVDRMVYL